MPTAGSRLLEFAQESGQYLHRNSVLYCINNLEKKYGLDLDSYSTRERLLTIFRFKILTSSKFRTLLT